MNSIFNDAAINTGIKDLETESNLLAAYETKIGTYKDLVLDDGPGKRMKFIYIDNEIQKLESELKTDTI